MTSYQRPADASRRRRLRTITAAPRSNRAVITNDAVEDPVFGSGRTLESTSVDSGAEVVTNDEGAAVGCGVTVADDGTDDETDDEGAAVDCGVTAADADDGAEVPPVFTDTAVNV